MSAPPLLEVEQVTKTYHLPGQDVPALRGVDLRIESPGFYAIMGPSGSGKTTLLNALAGQLKAGPKATLTGRLTVGGDLCGGAGEVSGLRVAYVRQEDVFYTQMTVRETLLFAARLRLPASTSLAEKERRVEEIISRRLLLPCRAPLRLFEFRIRNSPGSR